MKTFRQSLVVAVLLASIVGLQSTTINATAAPGASPPVRSATGCCWVYFKGMWVCMPC